MTKGQPAQGYILDYGNLQELIELYTDAEIPEGAEIVGIEYKAEYLGFLIAYKHPSFPEREEGVQIPIKPIYVKREIKK